MIGERLESHGHHPWEALVLVAGGLALAAAGWISGIDGLAIGAVLPIALGGSWWFLGGERPLTATFREDGLAIESAEGPILVPFASIQNIKAGGRLADPAGFSKPSCAIEVQHEQGLLRLPARLNFPSHEVYRFLAGRVPNRGGRDVNPVLADYLQRQEQYFGPDHVATFRAGARRAMGGRRGYRAFCIGLILTGAAWSAFGFSRPGETAWGLVGIVGIVIGVLLFTTSFAESLSTNPAIKNRKDASLVIGPHGMAMVQGDIQGEVRWPELLEIRFQARPRGFHLGYAGAIPGILLRVKGASILIADIYDRPLFVIHNRILAASGRSTPFDAE